MNTIRIYTLANPINGDIFYVGKTADVRNSSRLTLHICEARKNPETPKNYIINQILDSGFRPTIETIDEIIVENYDDWHMQTQESYRLEEYWINQFYQWGFKLTNIRRNPRFNNLRSIKAGKKKGE